MIIVIILVKFETNITLYIQGRYKILIRNIADFANIIEMFEQSIIHIKERLPTIIADLVVLFNYDVDLCARNNLFFF